MKELERSNRVAMIAHGVINACMLFISVIGFVEHTVSVPVLVVLLLLGIIPVLAEFICILLLSRMILCQGQKV